MFGYSAWSLVDGYEWNYGYSVRRGLFYVDFNQSNRSRVAKTSAQYYRSVISDNGFPNDETSTEVKGRFPCEFHWGVADSTLQVNRGGSEWKKYILQPKTVDITNKLQDTKRDALPTPNN